MGRNELCFCGSGEKIKKCHNDIHELSLASDLLRLYSKIVNELGRNYETFKNEMPCHKGCAECCFTDHPVSDVEFNMIVYEMWKWDEIKINEIIENAQKIWSIANEKYPDYLNLLSTDGTGNNISIKTNMIVTEQEFFRCPFLNSKDNSCLIYQIRPVICRIWGVGYLDKYMDIEGDYCSTISDFSQKKNWQADLSFLLEEIDSLDNIYIREVDHFISIRKRPLFYLLIKNQDIIRKDVELPTRFKKEFYESKSSYVKYNHDILKQI